MDVLFIGGTGTISTAVSALAVEKGINLYLLNRGQHRDRIPDGAHLIEADIRDESSLERALQGKHFDVVVNWIAFTEDQVEADIQRFFGKTAQYIFISSASIYQKPLSYYLITESTPLANPYWQYSRDKIACEERLMKAYREQGFPVTIVRPSHTYGKTSIPSSINSSSHPWSLIDRMLKGKEIVVHGDGTSLWTLTHNTDFAKAFVGLLGHSKAIGHAFHITSDEVLNWNQIYQAIGRAIGVEPNIVHMSSEFIARYAQQYEGGLLGDKAESVVFDNSKIKSFVPEYQATVRFEEGIRQTIQWFNEHPEKKTIDEEWNKLIDQLIAAHNR